MLFSPATSNRPNEFAFGSSQKCLREMASEDCGLVVRSARGGAPIPSKAITSSLIQIGIVLMAIGVGGESAPDEG